MRVAMAQLNPTVGDVAGNTALLRDAIDAARRDDADLLVAAEMVVLGYPPRDLLFRKGVVEACESAVEEIARYAGDLVVIVGHPRRSPRGTQLFRNSVSICVGGRVERVYDKRLLPGYDVFDEDRYFEAGDGPCVIEVAGRPVGILICEDLWQAMDVTAKRTYSIDPLQETVDTGCDLLILPNASPFILGKWQRHVQLLRTAATKHRIPIVALHTVGANDDLIFDGRSVVVDAAGSPRVVLPGWVPVVATIEVPDPSGSPGLPTDVALEVEPLSELYHALVLGIRDYVHKTGHRKVVVGASGGIDSSLTLTLAAAALGAENVLAVMMPSRYSSAASIEDATELAANLGLPPCYTVSIETVHQAISDALAATQGEATCGVTDENIQARVRGLLLMAISNTTEGLVLVPSNKSEMATGYTTIYGDMSGALSVLGDLVKTRVYALCEWINAHPGDCGFTSPPIPQRCLTKAPSAELRPNQTDQDTLPPYELLDQIIERHVEREQSTRQIIEETDLDPELVRQIAGMIDRAQYKRDQAAVVLKVTDRTFGPGRPMPIAMRWEEASRPAGTPVDQRATRRNR